MTSPSQKPAESRRRAKRQRFLSPPSLRTWHSRLRCHAEKCGRGNVLPSDCWSPAEPVGRTIRLCPDLIRWWPELMDGNGEENGRSSEGRATGWRQRWPGSNALKDRSHFSINSQDETFSKWSTLVRLRDIFLNTMSFSDSVNKSRFLKGCFECGNHSIKPKWPRRSTEHLLRYRLTPMSDLGSVWRHGEQPTVTGSRQHMTFISLFKSFSKGKRGKKSPAFRFRKKKKIKCLICTIPSRLFCLGRVAPVQKRLASLEEQCTPGWRNEQRFSTAVKLTFTF